MPYVETETHGAVRVIRLNRPERLNAMGADMVKGMADAFNDVDNDDCSNLCASASCGRASALPRYASPTRRADA